MLENRMGDSIYLLLLLILQIKDFFLCLDFCTQFFFRGQIQLVFTGKKLLVAVEDRIFGNVLVRIGAKDNADSRVIALAALQFVIHTDVHIHEYLREWKLRREQVLNHTITVEEYTEWVVNWPDTSDVFVDEPSYRDWKKTEE